MRLKILRIFSFKFSLFLNFIGITAFSILIIYDIFMNSKLQTVTNRIIIFMQTQPVPQFLNCVHDKLSTFGNKKIHVGCFRQTVVHMDFSFIDIYLILYDIYERTILRFYLPIPGFIHIRKNNYLRGVLRRHFLGFTLLLLCGTSF